jgi:hypothetical protein
MRQGLKVPDKIANAPELLPWLRAEYSAFFELGTCRTELNPIPWTAIHQYAVANGFADTQGDLYRFTQLIRAMDIRYIEILRERHQKAQTRTSKINTKGKK